MIIKTILTPLSWVYGLITGLRNLLYNKSILPSFRPPVPVIVVGNLVAGGTGKTPVVAWLAAELSKNYRVAILSRGYGRRTRGFQLAGPDSTPDSIGDESMELRQLLPGITIAVDGNRKHGILELLSVSESKPEIILMDDGFQHRRVTPGFALLLDNYNQPARNEKMIPVGLRREPLSGMKRADLIVETKKEVFATLPKLTRPVLLVTGIADPVPLEKMIRTAGFLGHHLKFPDHHRYTRKDALLIIEKHRSLNQSVILTTGKDFVKLSRFRELDGLPLETLPAPSPLNEAQKQNILNKINHYVGKAIGNR